MKVNDFEIDENTSIFSYVWKIALVLMFIGIISIGWSWFSGAASVAKREFGAEAGIKKYEWFKNASHELERKIVDINLYQKRVNVCYDKKQRNCGIIEEQLFGIKSSYNGLVASYNANSDKFNWTLFNAESSVPKRYNSK